MSERTVLAIDWGTSSLRGACLDAHGDVVQERSFARGILTVPPGEFPATFDDCPAGFEEVAAKLAWLKPVGIAVVPGLCCENEGIPDVMRGEETQIFGVLQLLTSCDA